MAASHQDGSCTTSNCIPEGALIRLDSSYDVDASAYPAWQKKLLHAMQTYGGYVGDRGGVLEVRAQEVPGNDAAWTSQGIGISPSLSTWPWSRMHVLQLTPWPRHGPDLVDGRLGS